MSSHFNDVKSFHQKFGLEVADKLRPLTGDQMKRRILHLQEELDEFVKACGDRDMSEQADALVDLVYVAIGTGVIMGLPWQELWDDVQRANMDKVKGVSKRGHDFDVVKPEGWEPPKIAEILRKFGASV